MRVKFSDGSAVFVENPKQLGYKTKHNGVEYALMMFDISDYISAKEITEYLESGIKCDKKVVVEKALNPDESIITISDEELMSYAAKYVNQLLAKTFKDSQLCRYIGRQDSETKQMIIATTVKKFIEEKIEPRIIEEQKNIEEQRIREEQQLKEERIKEQPQKNDFSDPILLEGKEIYVTDTSRRDFSEKEYKILGDRKAIYRSYADGGKEKTFIEAGFITNENTRVREPRLDRKMVEIEEADGTRIRKMFVPLIDFETDEPIGKCKIITTFEKNGDYESEFEKEYESTSGKKYVIKSSTIKRGDTISETRWVNGIKAFEVIQDSNGIRAFEYTEKRNNEGYLVTVINSYHYDKDGKLATKKIVGKDGKAEATIETSPYKGIEQLPSENPLEVFAEAGYPKNVLDFYYKNINLEEFGIFDRLNKKITAQEKLTSSRRPGQAKKKSTDDHDDR